MGTATAIGFGARGALGAFDALGAPDAASTSPAGAAEVVRAMTLRALWVAPVAFVVVLLATALLALLVVREVDGPWTERARRTLPMRRVTTVFSTFLALLPPSLVYFALQRALPAAERRVVAVAVLGASLLAMELVRVRVEARVHRRSLSIVRWLAFKTTWLPILAPHLLVAFASAALLPHAFTTASCLGALLALAALLVSATGVAWLPLRALGVIRPAPARVLAAVERAAVRVGVRPLAVYVVPTFGVPVANAFALPILRRVAFTDEAVALLDDDELAAIAAHELGHVGEPRAVAWGRSVLAFMLAPIAVAPVVHAALGLPGMLAAFVIAMLATRAYRQWSQRLEARADDVAHAGTHEHEQDPGEAKVYARALERLYERNLAPAVMPGKTGTHPHLYDRLLAAGVTPEYPRPAAPQQRREVTLGALVLSAYAVALGVAFVHGQDAFEREAAQAYAAKAERAVAAGQVRGAVMLYDDATRLSHRDPAIYARAAELSIVVGECTRAQRELTIAMRAPGAAAAKAEIAAALHGLRMCDLPLSHHGNLGADGNDENDENEGAGDEEAAAARP
jgi:Zn-dependent protease with chaperone function